VESAAVTLSTTNNYLMVGNDPATPDLADNYDGELDEVQIFNSALSSTDVSRLYSSAGATSPYKTLVMSDTPLAYYYLNETGGTAAADATGNGNGGSYNGTFTLGQSGGVSNDPGSSVLFSTSGGHMDSSVTSGSDGSFLALTMEAWVNFASVSGNQHVMGRTTGNSSYSNTGSMGIVLNDYTAAAHFGMHLNIQGTSSCNDGGGDCRIDCGTALSASTWYHIAVTYNSSGNVVCYTNGVQTATASWPSGGVASLSSGFFRVGEWTNSGGSQYPMGGNVQDAAFYSQALSAAQIRNHYCVGSGQTPGC